MTDYAAQADQYRRDSAKAYRQGRRAQVDAERWDQCAVNCDRLAAWFEGREDDPEDDLTSAQHADLNRRNAESLRELAESERRRAPECRQRGRDLTRHARQYQTWADEQTARIAEWAASPERAEWLARPENAALRELDAEAGQ